MSHTYNALANTKNEDFKFHHRNYLVHDDEPKDESSNDRASTELNADLIKNSYYQKRKLRRAARRLRYES